MFGQQPGYAVCKDATHGVERSKDDDSISGVCRRYGCLHVPPHSGGWVWTE